MERTFIIAERVDGDMTCIDVVCPDGGKGMFNKWSNAIQFLARYTQCAASDVELDAFSNAFAGHGLYMSSEDHAAPMTDTFDVRDIEDASLERLAADCAAFLATKVNPENSVRAVIAGLVASQRYTIQHAAFDFWLTRNDVETGFGTRGFGLIGDSLTKIAEKFGPCSLEQQDGKLRYRQDKALLR